MFLNTERQMSETKSNEIGAEQLSDVAGGSNFSCDAADYIGLVRQLNETYEELVGFASHVIERVANAVKQ